jgi:hypothetical protein
MTPSTDRPLRLRRRPPAVASAFNAAFPLGSLAAFIYFIAQGQPFFKHLTARQCLIYAAFIVIPLAAVLDPHCRPTTAVPGHTPHTTEDHRVARQRDGADAAPTVRRDDTRGDPCLGTRGPGAGQTPAEVAETRVRHLTSRCKPAR